LKRAAVAALLLCTAPAEAQVLTPEDVAKLPYSHPVIVDCVIGPAEAESPGDYARIVWVDPITHERHVRDKVRIHVSGPALLNVAVASPRRAGRCDLSVVLDGRTILQRSLTLDPNSVLQESVELPLKAGVHYLQIELASPDGGDHVSCRLEVVWIGGNSGSGHAPLTTEVLALGTLLACLRRRW